MSNPLDDLKPIEFDWIDDNCTMGHSDTISITDLGSVMGSSITTSTVSTTASMYSPSTVSITGAQGSILGQNTFSIGAVGSSSNWNGTFTVSQAKLQIDTDGDEGVIFKTKDHTVNWDKLVDDIQMIKRAFITMSNNEDLMNKYPEIRDMLAEWMLRELK